MSDDRKNLHTVNELFTDSSDKLSSLYTHALALIRLQDNLKANLSAPLNEHVTVANYDNKTLIIQTDTPAWAAKLRFKIPDLLSVLRENCGLTDLKTIRIKISVPENKRTVSEKHLVLSNQSSDIIRNMANTITDPDLRQTLLKISENK